MTEDRDTSADVEGSVRPADDHTRRFAENLRRLRWRVGISTEGLARRAEVNRTHVGSLDGGTKEPRPGTLIRLIGALDTTSAEILVGISWRPGKEEQR